MKVAFPYTGGKMQIGRLSVYLLFDPPIPFQRIYHKLVFSKVLNGMMSDVFYVYMCKSKFNLKCKCIQWYLNIFPSKNFLFAFYKIDFILQRSFILNKIEWKLEIFPICPFPHTHTTSPTLNSLQTDFILRKDSIIK